MPERFEGVEPSDEELEPARVNFAVLLLTVEEADWFYLSNDGHVRAQFLRGEGRWVAP